MNSRRSFFKQLLTGIGTFAILPPALTYDRIWRAERQIITCAEFTQVINDQVPVFDALICKEYCGQWRFFDLEEVDKGE